MFDVLYKAIWNVQNVAAFLAAISVVATILTLAMPYMSGDKIASRMKSVATERDRIRAREREKLNQGSKGLRQQPKAYMKRIVQDWNLTKWLGKEDAREKLAQAGYRGQQAEVAFLFFRMVAPIALSILSVLYLFIIVNPNLSTPIKLGICLFATWFGIQAPDIIVKNTSVKRQKSIKRAFPDAMDLMLICVESGMAVEPAFKKVAAQIGSQSIELAEELALATAELSYLPDRRTAYENLALRTGVDGVKQVAMVLIQAEKYGTPLGHALRIVSQESRDTRMMEAEKKAAGLPPKLTVPMIIFFLPVLFAVIITPAAIMISRTWK